MREYRDISILLIDECMYKVKTHLMQSIDNHIDNYEAWISNHSYKVVRYVRLQFGNMDSTAKTKLNSAHYFFYKKNKESYYFGGRYGKEKFNTERNF